MSIHTKQCILTMSICPIAYRHRKNCLIIPYLVTEVLTSKGMILKSTQKDKFNNISDIKWRKLLKALKN